MSKRSAYHVSTNIPSARTTIKSAASTSKSGLSISTRPTLLTQSKANDAEFVNHNALDTFRRETMRKEEESRRVWKAKFDPWFIDEYRQMYESIAKNRGVTLDNCVISLKRSEWQQPADVLPPLYKRLAGQRRRRILGAFPETENDKIGWRLLPQHAIDKYGGSKTANIAPLPRQYKFSSWPVESYY